MGGYYAMFVIVVALIGYRSQGVALFNRSIDFNRVLNIAFCCAALQSGSGIWVSSQLLSL